MEPSGYEVPVCDGKPPGKKRFAIIVAYGPPNYKCSIFFLILDETMVKVSSNYSLCLVTGDFNMTGIEWSCSAPKCPSYVNNFLLNNSLYML